MSEFSPEEQAVLDSFVDPDGETVGQYEWDEELQRHILALMLTDRFFLIQSQGLVEPRYFTDEVHQLVSKILLNYFEEYKSLPNRIHLKQEVIDSTADKKPETKVHYLSELNTVYNYYVPGVDSREYLLNKITNFAKIMALKTAVTKIFDILKKTPENQSTWLQVQEIVRNALNVDRNIDIGLEYFQTFEERYQKMEEAVEQGDIFTSGFPHIDAALMGGGLGRGEMAAFLGISGTGKSLCLVGAALANLHAGKKVLYVSLEMDPYKVSERFDAQLADPQGIHGVTINNLQEKKDIVIQALRDYISDKEDERLLIIKQFPGGEMDVAKFRAYYTQVQQYGFQPDLVIIDYIGEMKDYPGIKTYESRYQIVRNLRGFAVEEQICIMTALQPNRSAKEAIKLGDVLEDENLADSYDQVRPLDALWSINVTKDEKDCNLGRIFISKHRSGESKKTLYVEYNKKTLRISEISHEKYRTRLETWRTTASENAVESVSDILKQSEQKRKRMEKKEQGLSDSDKKILSGEYHFDDLGKEDEGPQSPDE